MIVTTSPDVPGKKIVNTLGLAKGNTIRARHVGKDIIAIFKNLVGGEIMEYTKLMAESREQAIDRRSNCKSLSCFSIAHTACPYRAPASSETQIGSLWFPRAHR